MTRKTVTPPSPPLSGGEPISTHSGSPLIRGAGGVSKSPKYLPYDKHLTALAQENRKNPTPAEQRLWHQVLGHRQFAQYKFQRQKPIGHYIVDFYCAALGLVIEVDGDSHGLQVEYDAQRSQFLQSMNLSVLRYGNQDVLQNLEGVFADLERWVAEREVKPVPPPSPPLSGGGRSNAHSDFLPARSDSPLTRGAGGVSAPPKKNGSPFP